MKIYECPDHDQAFEKNAKTCVTCHRILSQIKKNKEVRKRTGKVTKLRPSVYWPSRMGHEGRLIHNLEHKPVFFRNKDEFRDYLKRNHVAEMG